MSTRTILFLISSLRFGGAERQTISLINRLPTPEFDIHLGHLAGDAHLLSTVNPNLIGNVFCLEKRTSFDLRALRTLRRRISEIRPDVVVCVNPYPAIYAHAVRQTLRERFAIVQIMHSTLMTNLKYELSARWLYRPLINRSERVIFVSRNQMAHWQRTYGIDVRRATVIYNGIDTEHFQPSLGKNGRAKLRQQCGIGADQIVITICAALRPEKKHLDFLAAIKILTNKGLPVKALIVGDGPEKAGIEQYLHDQGMANRTHITGFQPDVRPYLDISDIVVLSSETETFSVAVLEALSMGKPVVAPRVGGIPEQVFPGENGKMYPVGDVRAMADCIHEILNANCCREMAGDIRRMVRERFSVERMAAAYHDVLTEVA